MAVEGEEEEGHQRAITPPGAFRELSQLLHTSEASSPLPSASCPPPSKEDFPSKVLSDGGDIKEVENQPPGAERGGRTPLQFWLQNAQRPLLQVRLPDSCYLWQPLFLLCWLFFWCCSCMRWGQ